MQIKRLSVNHFGKLDNLTVTLDDGINVISGKNESGKSTLHSFIKAMLFGLERGHGRSAKEDDYTRFIPWNGGTYGGAIEIEKDEKDYCISRNFSRDAKEFIVRNETDSKNLPSSADYLNELICGLTPALYRNTISVAQLLAKTNSELSNELKNHIVNMQGSGAMDVDVINAVASLKAEKKKLLDGYDRDAETVYEELNSKTDLIENELKNDMSAFELSDVEAKKTDYEEKVSIHESEKDKLTEIISENETFLRNNRVADSDDIVALTERTGKLTYAVSSFRHHHKICRKKAAKPIFTILFLLFAAGTVCAGYQTYRVFEKSAFSDYMKYIPAAPIMLICLIFTIIFLVNMIKAGKYKKLEAKFISAYKKLFGEKPEAVNTITIDRLAREPQKLSKTITTLRESKERLTKVNDLLSEEKNTLTELTNSYNNLTRLDWEREQKEKDLALTYDEIDHVREKIKQNDKINKEIAAINLAMENIINISDNDYESVGSHLEELMSCILESMTKGAYTGVEIDEELNVTLIAQGRRVELSSISTGTLDQVYLALRLAVIEFFWPEENMPVILDDTFAMYDSERLTNTLAWLSSFYTGQIIILTCHDREHEIFDTLGVRHNLIQI